jgi:hypothetical protein
MESCHPVLNAGIRRARRSTSMGWEESIDLGDRHPFGTPRTIFDAVSRADFSFPDNSKVEAGSPVRHQQRRHLGVIQTLAQFVAGDVRLADLEDCAADLKPVPDTGLVVGKSFDCEILAETAVTEIRSAMIALSVVVGSELINHDS